MADGYSRLEDSPRRPVLSQCNRKACRQARLLIDREGQASLWRWNPRPFLGNKSYSICLVRHDRENVKRQAHRLSALGFNLVRIHHHETCNPWVVPNIFGGRAALDTKKSLKSPMLEKLDWWIKSLEDEGIYVWLDLELGTTVQTRGRH